MSSCLSGGSRTFGFDLDIVKSTCTASPSRSSQTSSPSSTLSESSNNTLSTRKPRTPRKRPNQTYNEAAVLLSTAYPTIFSTKNLSKPSAKLHHTAATIFLDESSELLLPTDHLGSALCRPFPSYNRIQQQKSLKNGSATELLGLRCSDDFETSSILDEEMEEGIDSILGVASPGSEPPASDNNTARLAYSLGFAGLMMRRGVTALRQVDKGDWWRFPVIDVCEISPRLNTTTTTTAAAATTTTTIKSSIVGSGKAVSNEKKLKTKKKKISSIIEKKEPEPVDICSDAIPEEMDSELAAPVIIPSLILKLNYEKVVNAWSDRGSPFEEMAGADMSEPNTNIAMRLAQIDLFGEGGGVREASVLRYKEKRRTRLFSKKIRYQVRKVNADRRPRNQGRFVRRPNCQTMKKVSQCHQIT